MTTPRLSGRRGLFDTFRLLTRSVLGLACLFWLAACGSDPDTLTWDWSYRRADQSGTQIVASGTFVTGKTPNAEGFYTITAIAGSRLGVAITSLQPAATAIPDNEPYKVDNRIRPANPKGQLSKAGFGYGLANGTFENPFLAEWELPQVVYLAFLSKPPFGQTPPNTEEPRIVFEASIR